MAFILELGCALQHYGTPAHQVEATLSAVCSKVGLEGEFFSTPTSLMATFQTREGTEQLTFLRRIDWGEVQLGKLSRVDRIADQVVEGKLSFAEARTLLAAVEGAPARPRAALRAFAMALSSGSVAASLGGSWVDVATGAAVGAMMGVLAAAIARRTEQFFAFVASFVASAASVAGAHWWNADPSLTTLAGIILLVPGFGLTLAMSELAQRELVSGGARLMAALIVVVELGLGAALARRLLPPVTWDTAAHQALPSWVGEIAVVGLLTGFIVLFRVPRYAIAPMVAACVTGFYTARLGARLVGTELGPWLGAFCIGVMSNAYARSFKRPATAVLVPAVILLVPGSLSFQGLSAIIEEGQVLSGIQMMTSAFLIAASIVTGMLTANTLLPARRIL